MYGTKPAAVLSQPSGLFLIISVLLPIYPLFESAYQGCQICNSRGMHPRLIPDLVIRALQQSILPIRLGNKSNLDADSLLPVYIPADEPRPSSSEYALEPNLCRYS